MSKPEVQTKIFTYYQNPYVRGYFDREMNSNEEYKEHLGMIPGLDFYCPPSSMREGMPGLVNMDPLNYYFIDNEVLLRDQIYNLYNQVDRPNLDFGTASVPGRKLDNILEIKENKNHNYSTLYHYEEGEKHRMFKDNYNRYYYNRLADELTDIIIRNHNYQIQFGDVNYCPRYAYHFRYAFEPRHIVTMEEVNTVIGRVIQNFYNFIIYTQVFVGNYDTFNTTIHFIISNVACTKYKDSNLILSDYITHRLEDVNHIIDLALHGEQITRQDTNWGKYY